jgi:hypothetical protein
VESALFFENSGYDANLGLISSVKRRWFDPLGGLSAYYQDAIKLSGAVNVSMAFGHYR